MRKRIRDTASIVVAGLCLAIAIPALFAPEVAFTGITLERSGSDLVVGTVDRRSDATGVASPGMVVHDVDRVVVADLPEKTMDMAMRGDFLELGIVDPAGGWTELTFPPQPPTTEGFVFLVGVALLLGAALWVARGLAGETVRPLAVPLATAYAAPFLLTPVWSQGEVASIIIAVALPLVALLLLADGLLAPTSSRRRRIAEMIAIASAAAYVVVTFGAFGLFPEPGPLMVPIFMILLGAITIVPAIARLRADHRVGMRPLPRSPDRLPIMLVAATPVVISLGLGYANAGLGVSLPVIWLLVVVVLLQSNARVEVLRVQRDTVVAATEVERARLAADLHDDALQEMTVLVRRLDGSGDDQSAALARSIADRLREVCGDLRLPILDELGAGPALEWLVARVGETSGRRVSLEREDGARPPANVELAVFRVAQEALANALTHGAPPVVVRYASAADHATLSITDQGDGIAPDAAVVARRTGHYGLLNMSQRAEQIGGTIDVRREPGGGTSVGLDWSAT